MAQKQATAPSMDAALSSTGTTSLKFPSQQANNPLSKTNLENKRNSMLDYFRAKRQPKDKGKEKEDVDTSDTAANTALPSTPTIISKGKQKATDADDEPVLNEEDEAFLTRIISDAEEEPPALPARPVSSTSITQVRSTDAQVILMQGADNIPLPDAPETPEGEVARAIEGEPTTDSDDKSKLKPKSNRWSWLRRPSEKSIARNSTAVSLQSAADSLKAPPKPANTKPNSEGQVAPAEAAKEEDEMASVLEQLNLTAVNNRVFSISDESKELLKQFTLVLKDLVTGVPTAFHDLESLLTNSDQQLQKTYKSLPPFLQELIEKLPEKFGKSLGPEFLAAAAEKQGLKSGLAATGAAAAERMGVKIRLPSLKDLVTKQGSLVALLRSVMTALRTRFPAFLGMNVLWSLGLFVLLFVFWYCHKRGKEVRLEKERVVTEQEMEEIKQKVLSDPAWVPPPGWNEGTVATTRAPVGASVEDVTAGMGPRLIEAEDDVADGLYAPEGSLGKRMRELEEEKMSKQQHA